MIFLRDNSLCADMPRADRSLILSDSVFLEARDLFHAHEELRSCAVPLTWEDGAELPFSMIWKRNLTDDLPPDVAGSFFLYAGDLWEYSMTDGFLDFELIERGDVFLFDELEEYSYALARLIRAYYPDKYIFFKDPRASFFFEESELLRLVANEKDFYTRFSYLISRSIVEVSSSVMVVKHYDPLQFLEKRYTSLELMTSLFWAREIHSYGDKNPDKIFCVIKAPLGMQGLADMTRYPLYRAEIAARRGSRMVPIIDLSVPGDGNQFNGGNGENAWTMFYRQISSIPLEEVYQSRNVIMVRDQLTTVNPYIQEMIYFADYGELFARWLSFNDATRAYTDKLYADTVPDPNARILGVIGRGTDYNQSMIVNLLNQPAGPVAFLNRVREVFNDGGYDYLFLATEDNTVYQAFKSSDLAERMFCVEQPRVDYNARENNDCFLVDIYKKRERDPYAETLRYLGIIHILSRCTSLIASTDCGAYLIATGLNHGKYEYVEVYDHKKAEAEK